MEETSLLRTALLAALIAAFGLVAAGRAPAADGSGWLLRSASLSPDQGFDGNLRLLPAVLQRQHLPQMSDRGGAFIGGQTRGRDPVRFGPAPLQTDDESEVLAHARVDMRLCGRPP